VHPSSFAHCLALAALASVASCAGAPIPPVGGVRIERWGFTAPWDPRSAESVRANAGVLDGVVFGWIPLDTTTGLPFELYRDSIAHTAPPSVRRMAIVTSYAGGSFHPSTIRALALDPAALRRSADAVAQTARRGGYRGLVLDFEGMTRPDSDATRLVIGEMSRVARAAGVGPIVVAVPATDTASYPARYFDDSADLLLVMLYDQHWATSSPGPIAAPDWVRLSLGMRISERGASRLVAALPLYGYRWRPNTFAETIGYDDAVRLAAEAGTSLARDPASATLHATRSGADGWELWVSDAELVAILEREAVALDVRRFAYWRLGLEDRALWPRPTVFPRP
jgi:spore germination protein YaaH